MINVSIPEATRKVLRLKGCHLELGKDNIVMRRIIDNKAIFELIQREDFSIVVLTTEGIWIADTVKVLDVGFSFDPELYLGGRYQRKITIWNIYED